LTTIPSGRATNSPAGSSEHGAGDGNVRVSIGFKTSPQGVGWTTLDETWAAAGELEVFESAWMNDHLTDPSRDRGGSSFEAVTLLAALAHRVPGKRVGHIVLSNTFRHPAVLAKAATTLDHVTGGRFILGLGAGWHEHEHVDFGIPLPPIGERITRLESAVRVLRALFGTEAASESGVTLDDPFYPLHGAVNQPASVTPGGVPIWLGGQGPRGLRLAASLADGWFVPSIPFVDVPTFRERREILRRTLADVGRDPDRFAFVAQVPSGREPETLASARELALGYAAVGATHLVLGLPASSGPDGLRRLASEVAAPLRETLDPR
jgi:alkanesulfonate monooxygenase SsuD/methylene tetrahydromethanopterin reductase-like flavin-dependent oxidoreductase (luciferase family)